MLPLIETIAIGDELLTGRTSDTNSTFVGQQFFDQGFSIHLQTVIADHEERIIFELESRITRSDFVIVFGGLGPTSDDRTVEAVAKWLGTEIATEEKALQKINEVYQRLGREVTPSAAKQALVPKGVVVLENKIGLAPGFFVNKGRCGFYFLPGVPGEMKQIFRDHVLPDILKKVGKKGRGIHRTWSLLGIPESQIQTVLDPVEAQLTDSLRLGYRTQNPENHVTLYGLDTDTPLFEQRASQVEEILRPWLFTSEEKTLEELIFDQLQQKNLSLALAESCTGGDVSARLTRVPGISNYFWGGYACYQREAKASMLNVVVSKEEDTVSRECTLSLAKALKEKTNCSIVAAITGYMGPTGGTASDPIGTFYTAVIGDKTVEMRRQITRGDRKLRQRAAGTFLLFDILNILSK